MPWSNPSYRGHLPSKWALTKPLPWISAHKTPSPNNSWILANKTPSPNSTKSLPSGGAAHSRGAAPSRAMGGSPPYVRVSSFSPTNRSVGNVLLNEGNTPTNGAPPLLLAQISISSIDKGTNNNSDAPCSAISSDDLATVVARVKALKSLLLAHLTMLERSLGNHAAPTDLATLDVWISKLKSLLSAHATLSRHVRAVEQRVSLLDSSIMSIQSTINPTQHLPPVA